MLGAIVVNENNLVIHVFGDPTFRETISGSDLSSTPSTSSGIFSDRKSPFIELSADKPTDYVYQEIDHNDVLQIFLPLILLYRTMQEKNAECYESMVMDKLQIFFKESDASLLIGVADDLVTPPKLQKFMTEVDSVLGFHYGPMIKLVKADFPSIRKIRSKVEKRIQHVIAEYTSGKSDSAKVYSTELNAAYQTVVSNQRLLGELTAIPHQLQMYVGTSRCFFLKDGQLIASGNSTPNSIPTVHRFTPSDLRNIIQFAQISMDSSKTRRGTMEQVWLKLRPDGQRQIVNLFVVPLSDDIDMVCISSVNGSGLIEQLCTVVGILDVVRPGAGLAEVLSTLTVLLQKFCASLRNLIPNVTEVAASGGLAQYTFLRDTNRSAALLENLWLRLLSQFNQQPGTQTLITPPKGNSLIQRIRDSSSTLSNRWGSSNSIQSSSVSSARYYASRSTGFPVHVDALVAHFQRQLHNIMNELCSQAFYVAYNYKFDTLVKSVQRITARLHSHVSLLSMPSNCHHSLNPLLLGFDMKAYYILALDTRLSFSYCEDAEKRQMVEYAERPLFKRRIRKVDVEGKEYLLVELSNVLEYRINQQTIVSRLRNFVSREKKPSVESIRNLATPLFCSFLFDVFVNINLAIHQSSQLSLLLYEKLVSSQSALN
ncbi:hypothetical protein QR680_002251 [Steinernema hermaphroditum]|uniref:Uncharacterized protein n=1 Tax=Steinernema hermaphroditum TaxID=289476 RepID=A0AA39H446_9BILA|nr:hypothetical protein QR680_002251 [Steinernema hermaphroditum]